MRGLNITSAGMASVLDSFTRALGGDYRGKTVGLKIKIYAPERAFCRHLIIFKNFLSPGRDSNPGPSALSNPLLLRNLTRPTLHQLSYRGQRNLYTDVYQLFAHDYVASSHVRGLGSYPSVGVMSVFGAEASALLSGPLGTEIWLKIFVRCWALSPVFLAMFATPAFMKALRVGRWN